MFVFLFSPAGHLLTIDVKPDESVDSLRSKAIARIGSSSSSRSHIDLVYEDIILEDYLTLASYGIKEGAVIDIKTGANTAPPKSAATHTPASKLIPSYYTPSPGKAGGQYNTTIGATTPNKSADIYQRPLTAPTPSFSNTNQNSLTNIHNTSNSSISSDKPNTPYQKPQYDFSNRFVPSFGESKTPQNTNTTQTATTPTTPATYSSTSSQIAALQPVPPAYHLITFSTPLRVHHPLGTGRKMTMAKDAPSLHIFDLDDTLARNGVLPASVKQCLRQLRGSGARLAVASFNASAVEVLRENGVELFFDVIVCGWSPIARKTEHVAKAIEPLGWEQTVDGPRLYFFDDVPENVMDVRAAFPLSYCVRVYSVDVLPMLVSHCMQLDSQRLAGQQQQRLSPTSHGNNSYVGNSSSTSSSIIASPGALNSSLLSAAATPQTKSLQSFSKLSLDGPEVSHGVSLGRPGLSVKGLY